MDTLLEDVDAFRDHFVTRERRGGLVHLIVHPLGGGDSFPIEFDDPAYRVGLTGNAELDARSLRYSYSSLTTPTSVLELALDSGETARLKEEYVGGGFDRASYVSERIFARADDGTSVPISLVRRRDSVGSAGPLLLYGYGSYGSSQDARFSPRTLSLLDRGFTYGRARGGQELGRFWYEQGKLRRKMNTFTDFIACGEHLVAEDTTEDQLFALGAARAASMGAVANMRPTSSLGSSAVPFVDVDARRPIPLTTFEYDEWGNPSVEGEYCTCSRTRPRSGVAAALPPHARDHRPARQPGPVLRAREGVAKLMATAAPGLLFFECEMEGTGCPGATPPQVREDPYGTLRGEGLGPPIL